MIDQAEYYEGESRLLSSEDLGVRVVVEHQHRHDIKDWHPMSQVVVKKDDKIIKTLYTPAAKDWHIARDLCDGYIRGYFDALCYE